MIILKKLDKSAPPRSTLLRVFVAISMNIELILTWLLSLFTGKLNIICVKCGIFSRWFYGFIVFSFQFVSKQKERLLLSLWN